MSDNNGPAFPRPMPGAQYKAEELGLTKREYFAAMAMNGIASISAEGFSLSPQDEARWAVERADALLAALKEDDQ